MFDALFRGVHYKLQNLAGKRRDLYRKPPQTEVHQRDIKRWQSLEQETAEQLENTRVGLTALANATATQVQIDQLWMDLDQLYGQAKKQRSLADFKRRAALSGIKLEVQGARFEMMSLLNADAHQEQLLRASYLEGKQRLLGGDRGIVEKEEEKS